MGLGKIYEIGLLIVIVGVVIHAPVVVGLGQLLPDYADLVKAWKEILLAVLALVAIALITQRKLWTTVLKSPFIVLSLAFIDLHLILSLFAGGNDNSVIAGLMIDLRFIVIFMLAYILILLRPQALGRIVKSVLVGAVVVIGFGVLQITVLPDNVLSYLGYSSDTISPYITIDRNPDFVRINSTLRGPNPLGALMVIYLSLGLAYLLLSKKIADQRKRFAVIGLTITSAAVLFASYSRSAYVALLAAVATIALTWGRFSKKTIGIALAGLVVVAIGGMMLSQTSWFSNVILHENPNSASSTKSNDGHIDSLADGVERLINQPFGAGIGSTGAASLYDTNSANDLMIENYYLFVAHESGWLGLILFIALFGLTLAVLWRKRSNGWLPVAMLASGVGLAFIGLLLPVWADETVALIWWALAGATIAHISGIIKGGNAKRTRKQKTARIT